ncbi:M20/M25/M40 family metallo-hydrolase [Parasphingopyxis marina]|uniref:M20/M25/M40 family metallo-hydrolase n=1 Tax=Parasphingopyxis marina TaxID=2761622 RepID=A0A842HZ34_9SPHN|nr:M20/M25/M40 family metallo-hydrolase [Parasphingopyxis marina]MBC2777777.1 M20/M25/M40 family metallo-hydrolase [Parasphingopyxis marina]
MNKTVLTGALAMALPLAPTAIFAQEPATYDAEIAAIRAAPAFTVAADHIGAQHAARLEDLVTLTEIPAPPFAEETRAAAYAEMMRATGFGEVSIDEVGNVVAVRPGRSGDRAVAMVAHIDTVFPAETDVTVTIEGNRYAAPGIGDNTRGAVMLLELASAIAAADIETEADLILVGNVGEEGLGDLRGVRHLFREGADHPDAMIAIDGGDETRLVTGAIGSNRYRVTFHGPGGHSWGDFGDPNPHHAAARAVTLFAEAARPITLEGNRSSFNIGRTGGGTSVNSIPFESWMEVDMRSGDPERLALLDEAFQAAMQAGLAAENDAMGEGDRLTVEIEPIGLRPAGQGDVSMPLVQRALAALRASGLEADTAASSTDANIPISMGIPAITISRCGSGDGAHSLGEYWVDDESVVPCTVRGLTILLAEAGLAAD